MSRFFRFSPARLALVYIALGVLALSLFAIPLWYGWRANILTFRAYVQGEDMQRLVDIFEREGVKALATAMESQVRNMPADQIMVLADASKARLAGNLPAWPAKVPDAPGTYGLVIGLGGESTMRVVASHVRLPGGYHLLMGRESVRFESLVERFWYGITGALVIVVILGAVLGWLSHRALLSEANEITRTVSAIVEADISRRVATRGGSKEVEGLARTPTDRSISQAGDMNPSGITGQRLVAVFLLGCAFFNYPLLSLFNKTGEFFDVPLLYIYIFAAWGVLITLMASVIEKRRN